jgi:hypothetical protein
VSINRIPVTRVGLPGEPPRSASVVVVGVGHPVARAAPASVMLPRANVPVARSESAFVGVGHEVEALSDVRPTDARSAQIGRPDGVTRSFQVRRNKVEPREAVRARNLLSKDD